MAIKHRVLINDHGEFTLFGMHVQLPAMLDLTEEQIAYINNTGLYKISELSARQKEKAKATSLSSVEGDRFEHSRSISVNELSFKTPIMATKFKEKAKNALIVKRNSTYLHDKDAIENNKNAQKSINQKEIVKKPFINNNESSNKDKLKDNNIAVKPENNNKSSLPLNTTPMVQNNNNSHNDDDKKKKESK